jgi:hypothetical protein
MPDTPWRNTLWDRPDRRTTDGIQGTSFHGRYVVFGLYVLCWDWPETSKAFRCLRSHPIPILAQSGKAHAPSDFHRSVMGCDWVSDWSRVISSRSDSCSSSPYFTRHSSSLAVAPAADRGQGLSRRTEHSRAEPGSWSAVPRLLRADVSRLRDGLLIHLRRWWRLRERREVPVHYPENKTPCSPPPT